MTSSGHIILLSPRCETQIRIKEHNQVCINFVWVNAIFFVINILIFLAAETSKAVFEFSDMQISLSFINSSRFLRHS